jgi:alpha-mannosidase
MNNIALQPDQGDLWNPGRAPVNGSLLRAAPLYDPMPRSGILPQHEGPIALQAADADAMWWPSVRVAEAGPLRAALEVRYRAPEVRTTLYLHHDEKMIRFVTRFMPRGNRYRLRAIFPTMLRGGAVRASIPFGWIRRPDGEYPAQDWLEYARDGHGLLLLNRGLPGNNVTDGVLMLSLFRAVAMEDRDAEPWYEEGVEQVFEYALRPFGPRERGYDPVREAERYVRPLLASLVRVVAGTIAVSSLREVDGEVEVRVYETSGHASDAALSFSHPVEGCRSVDFRGRSAARGRVQADGKCLRLALEAFQVMTLRFKWKGFP